MNLYDRIYQEWNKGKMITRLIMVNVFVFLIANILIITFGLFDGNIESQINDVLAFPTSFKKLIFRPWTIITSGFTHYGLFHILFNMLWLYWIGRTLQDYIGIKKILPIYIYGVIAGCGLMFFFYNTFPYFSEAKSIATLVGASAGVMAIIWATVALLPNHKINLLFLGPIPLVYLALFYTVIDVLSILGSNAGGNIAHIGGALAGFWFIKMYQRGHDFSVGFNNVVDGFVGLFQKRNEPKLKVKRGGKSKQVKPKTESQKKYPSPSFSSEESKLNDILDKINEKGYSSLSEKEKAFLKEQSKT